MKYFAYASDYSIDPKTGLFTLGTDEAPVTFINSCYGINKNDITEKYYFASYNEIRLEDTKNLRLLYKSREIPDLACSYGSIGGNNLLRGMLSIEHILTKTAAFSRTSRKYLQLG